MVPTGYPFHQANYCNALEIAMVEAGSNSLGYSGGFLLRMDRTIIDRFGDMWCILTANLNHWRYWRYWYVEHREPLVTNLWTAPDILSHRKSPASHRMWRYPMIKGRKHETKIVRLDRCGTTCQEIVTMSQGIAPAWLASRELTALWRMCSCGLTRSTTGKVLGFWPMKVAMQLKSQ